MSRPIRIAARAVLIHDDRLLLVNAWPGPTSDLWCAPGGGAEPHVGLPQTLIREVREETGLEISVGEPCLINEWHSPERGMHQVEVFFRCRLVAGALDDAWRDPEGIVTRRRWVTRAEVEGLHLRPLTLPSVAWEAGGAVYDPLERMVE
ncbi:NUDIX domain-containing protein [Jannaschia rubra]|uniref:Bifunctional nicotinamide mononucleotide adenylyltransferase/ADP-ribose pyrophosphatase n=1 Tax=Jannaschia rubra TaxID=282197 RepID=A0A0M6XPX1_9RHOB|nr:NUDIX hydrolase [Jannaschia rubra]CTQ32195.1 bifunctional nicotinamide mononucleotide adenylyltransferase/ADP-ribose pyrophosphatase [Jannaschia rubra]SFG35358.1 ADP-ribose pyrophosphatase YjhB, NUDIX family [Jannaschia rubra]